MHTTPAFAAATASSRLDRTTIPRREPGPRDVEIDIMYCGVCHSDLHAARGEWAWIQFPVVPGHEIVGRVTRVGAEVSAFRPGDLSAVGCLVDSCKACPSCASGLEQYCRKEAIFTYGSADPHGTTPGTLGGYSRRIVVDERFVLRISPKANLAATAPLLCAGITMYSPLRHWGAGKGKKVGIVGLGGLGHMGVKLAHAMGAHTVLFTSSPGKTEDGRRLGADDVVVSRNESELARHADSFDLIINTVSVSHNLDTYVNLLRLDGTMCLVGAPATPHPSPAIFPMLMRRRRIAGSAIGGIRETQEMLDFCAERGITSDIEIISMHAINEAYERMLRSDVKYRFVIDMASLG